MGTWSWRGVAFRLVLASAIGAALVTGGAVGHADPDPGLTPNEQQFVNNLASIGVTPTAGSRGLVGLGYHFCSELSSGKTRESMANRAYAEITGSTPQQAKAALDFAIKDLCPAAPPISAGRDQQSAEQAIRDGYAKKLANCYATRNAVPNIQSISWDPPAFLKRPAAQEPSTTPIHGSAGNSSPCGPLADGTSSTSGAERGISAHGRSWALRHPTWLGTALTANRNPLYVSGSASLAPVETDVKTRRGRRR